MVTAHHFTLDTDRLHIRPFVLDDLDALSTVVFEDASTDIRREWLAWQVANYTALARLWQPPYGDRAITRKDTGEVIGSVGFVQSWGPFDKLPYFRSLLKQPPTDRSRPEFGMFWTMRADQRGQGYATEAARAMIDYAFREWHVQRIVATTEYDNAASLSVMRKLGMTIERNPDPQPEWFQAVGVVEGQ
ncbi:MAG: GNAT family N-acetyltransferase [Chloroflexota bacterium]|nr:GNAT family N-acetyltransferase [Chloroflexota bacterium]